MLLADLAFDSGEPSITVREFVVREAISTLFDITVHTLSPNEALDLDTIVGHPVAFRIGGATPEARRWTGIVRSMRQTSVEPTGLSTYTLMIAPALWLLSQRTNHRIFQHAAVPEIIGTILSEWSIESVWRVDVGKFPRLEIRVQYGESDLAFISRLLEDSGIAYLFVDGGTNGTLLVLTDAPGNADARPNGPLDFMANLSMPANQNVITDVEVSREVRPGKITLRDADFRRASDMRLFGRAAVKDGESRYEQDLYEPGGFAIVTTAKTSDAPVADDRGIVRADEKMGQLRAEQRLASLRAGCTSVSFRTNAVDLTSGMVFSIAHHPRPELAISRRLLVTELLIKGTQERSFSACGTAFFADEPYAPERKTPKPRIDGVQSAIVVGPRSGADREEIHTDEFGRVRVQFAWDRIGAFDERSSCWLRVSQSWAGGGHGMMALPRVGHEVLVGFFEGDPDQPIVVGRVYNNTTRVPYKLPENKAKSTWRSDSTPGSQGFNEIMFDDAQGAEMVYVQAERNLEKLVKGDESARIGRMRHTQVGVNETILVGANRTTSIGAMDSTWVGERHAVTMRQAAEVPNMYTGTDMVPGRITLTTGQSTITLQGPDITLEAAARILMKAGTDIAIAAGSHVTVHADVTMTLKSGAKLVVQADDGDVVIQGGPRVRINPEDLRWQRTGKKLHDLPVEAPPGVDFAAEVEAAEDHEFYDPDEPNWYQDKLLGDDWDFRSDGEKYRAFGCFFAAVVGKAAGLPEGSILRQAGLRKKQRGECKVEHGDPGNGLWGGVAPFGLDPVEMAAMQKGFTFFNERQA